MTFSCLVSSQWSIKIEKSQTIQSWHESNWLHTRTYIPSSSFFPMEYLEDISATHKNSDH
jgi:hypothetical protein